MTKSEYKAARKLIRANGTYAYKWLDFHTQSIFKALATGSDELRDRQFFFSHLTYSDGSGKKYDSSPRKIPALKQWIISTRIGA